MAAKGRCEQCTGLCCRYFALPIETPRNREDYDDIRWYLCHRNTSVFVEKGDWYLSVSNKCRHLSQKNHTCLIYDRRPNVCRTYRHDDCDAVPGEYDYELRFTDDRQMDEYIRVKFGNNVTEKRKRVRSGKKSKA
ncbi:MAG: YkgJ family cysteine cluster protein [Sedimentisphaerales bacterium]|nr:YkgJ family cysteine cluster protein [Sedimentisphaerales bacterium]